MSNTTIHPDSVKIHPDAAKIRMMTDEEYTALFVDMSKHGQRVPATICQGKLLDGRNRAKVCRELGIDLIVEDYGDTDTDTVAAVYSLNVARRHLTAGQKAFLGADLANLEHGANQHREKEEVGIPTSSYTRTKAASIVGTHPQEISLARKIAKEAPELVEPIREGKATLGSAKQKLRKRAAAVKPDVVTQAFADLGKRKQNQVLKHLETVKAEIRKDAQAEVCELRQRLHEDELTVAAMRKQLDTARRMIKGPFTRAEYKMILGTLHPDRNPHRNAAKAFDMFQRLEKVCK